MIDENKKLQQLSTFTWKETKSTEEERKKAKKIVE